MMEPLEIDTTSHEEDEEEIYEDEDGEFQSLVFSSDNSNSKSKSRNTITSNSRERSNKGGRGANKLHPSAPSSGSRPVFVWLVVAVILSILLYQIKGRLYPEDDTTLLPAGGTVTATNGTSSSNFLIYNQTVLNLRTHPPSRSSLVSPRQSKQQPSHSKSRQHVTGNVEWLLDFSIVGFPKCGTSFLEYWLNQSNSIFVDDHDVSGLSSNQPAQVVNHLYDVVLNLNGAATSSETTKQTPRTKLRRIGMTNPSDIDSLHALGHYQQFFPSTKLIVVVRHPVWWFQSFYNFRYRNTVHHNNGNTAHHSFQKPVNDGDGDGDDDNNKIRRDIRAASTPVAHHMLGGCWKKKSPHFNSSYSCDALLSPDQGCDFSKGGICTNRARFHHAISRLGLTALTTKDEWELLDHHKMSIVPTLQDVLFLELSQLQQSYHERDTDTNNGTATSKTAANDGVHAALQEHLGVDDLPPMPKYQAPYQRMEGEIDVCEERFDQVRQLLVAHGARASHWILTYLLSSNKEQQHRSSGAAEPVVKLANRADFIQLVEQWNVDPCAASNTRP